MIKGLFTAASSMVTSRQNLDVVANNLANTSTTGFKRQEGVKRSFPEVMMKRMEKSKPSEDIGRMGTGVHLTGTYTDFRNGNLRYTEGELDFALAGEGFFVVQTPEEIRYTRNGDFTLNQQGQLVTQQGYLVLGENEQPLQIIAGEEIFVDGSGFIHSGLEGADRMAVTAFDDQSLLTKTGQNGYQIGQAEEIEAGEVLVKQFYLEDSNVNLVEEMTKMIEKNRLYEANQKLITVIDENLGQAVNEIARLN